MMTTDDHVVRMEVEDLVARFADAVSRRDVDTFGDLWIEDGEWVVPGMGTTAGRSAIKEQLGGLLSQFESLTQLVFHGLVRSEDDGASGRWYLMESGVDSESNPVQFVGVYHDDVVRDGGVWRFRRRRFDFLSRAIFDAKMRTYPFPDVDLPQ